jgi:hypothetical protein
MLNMRRIVVWAFIAVLAACTSVFPENPTAGQGGSEQISCRQLYQSYTRCYETGQRMGYEACVAAAHQTSEELLTRLGQIFLIGRASVRDGVSARCETAKTDTFLAYHDFERAMCL